jgi:uncharacterized damage-inducible protein DinB
MKWKDLLLGQMEYNYHVADKLLDLVDEKTLDWKPSAQNNWMTVGQLLKHISYACGSNVKGFVTGDWGCPEGVDPYKLSPEEMLPPAEKMPTVKSVKEAKTLLAEDRKLALAILAGCTEERLDKEIAKAPWDNMDFPLGVRVLQMIAHLNLHKGQLFYYLKLQGLPVNTGHLWGM